MQVEKSCELNRIDMSLRGSKNIWGSCRVSLLSSCVWFAKEDSRIDIGRKYTTNLVILFSGDDGGRLRLRALDLGGPQLVHDALCVYHATRDRRSQEHRAFKPESP